MNPRSRFVSLFTAALLCSAITSPSFAADPAPSVYDYSWNIPILQGEYMAINGGTLGSLSLGFTSDANHTFGGGVLFYDATGKGVVQPTGGQVFYNDDATRKATGVIAWTDISTYATSDGPCRGCADHPRQQTKTSDVSRFEWTSPRAGRFTVNGQTQDMVEAVSGPPLVAPTDFSGDWLMVFRGITQPKAGAPINAFSRIGHVTLMPVSPRTYASTTDTFGSFPPYGDLNLPSSGARQYNVLCNDPVLCALYANAWGDFKAPLQTIWFDDTDVGGVLQVRDPGGTPTVADIGVPPYRAYGRSDMIVVRRDPITAALGYFGLQEIAFFRLGPNTLKNLMIALPPPPQ